MAETKARGAVVITGTSTGIGRATALKLAGMGFRVFAGVRKETDGAALKKQAPGITPLMIDVTKPESIAAAADQVSKAVGEAGIAGLVNNAGVSVPGPLEFLPLEDLRQQLEVNVVGPIAVTQAFLLLVRKGHGRIVNISSIGGRLASPFLGAYHASKFAMEGFTDSLRQELRPWGIHVSLVEPGGVSTPFWDKGKSAADDFVSGMPEEANALYGKAIDAVKAAVPKFEKRAGPPEAVATAIAHALTAKRPRTRYLVGLDARMTALISRVMPDRWMDSIVASQVGLPKKR